MTKQQRRGYVQPLECEDYRFHCPSDSLGAPPYLVDLEAHGGRGECGCGDWRCKRHPNMQQGETELEKVVCKHGKRCLKLWARRLLHSGEPSFAFLSEMNESQLMHWAYKEIRLRVREKRKQMNGRKESE